MRMCTWSPASTTGVEGKPERWRFNCIRRPRQFIESRAGCRPTVQNPGCSLLEPLGGPENGIGDGLPVTRSEPWNLVSGSGSSVIDQRVMLRGGNLHKRKRDAEQPKFAEHVSVLPLELSVLAGIGLASKYGLLYSLSEPRRPPHFPPVSYIAQTASPLSRNRFEQVRT